MSCTQDKHTLNCISTFLFLPVPRYTFNLKKTNVVLPTLLYINAGTTKVPTKEHKKPSLRLACLPVGRSAILLKNSRQAGMTIIMKEIYETLH
jgi:hypothetical protein